MQYSDIKNGKWYAVIMTVEKSKLGLDGKEPVDIMDVKCDPDMTNMIIQLWILSWIPYEQAALDHDFYWMVQSVKQRYWTF